MSAPRRVSPARNGSRSDPSVRRRPPVRTSVGCSSPVRSASGSVLVNRSLALGNDLGGGGGGAGRPAGSGPTAVNRPSAGARCGARTRLQVPDLERGSTEPKERTRTVDLLITSRARLVFHRRPSASRKVCGARAWATVGFRGCPPTAAHIRPRCYTVAVISRSVQLVPGANRPRPASGESLFGRQPLEVPTAECGETRPVRFASAANLRWPALSDPP